MNKLKKYNKTCKLLMILGMFLSMLMPTGGMTVEAEGGKDLGNIFTLKSFKINDIEANENLVVEIKDETEVKLDYTWDTTELDAKSGDYAEIEIPDAFKLENFEAKDIKLKDDTVVGKYSLTGNIIKFDFNDNIEIGEVKNGTLGFFIKFNEEKFEENIVKEIKFNDRAEKTLTIIGKPNKEINAITKIGLPLREGIEVEKDASKIKWTIDIINPSNKPISDSTLKDVLPEGLSINTDSFNITDLNIKLNGDLSPDGDSKEITPTINGQSFEINLPTINPYKGYSIEYTTTITDKSISQFTNKASFEYGGKELPADATVTVERSADIEKDGEYKGYNKDKKYDEIEWWIDVNKSGGSINKAIVEDTLLTEVTFVPGSIEIVKITQDGIESESGKTAAEFPVKLGNLEGQAYRIKFKTSIDYSKVNNGEYQEYNSFTNKTILKNGDEEIGEAEKTVEFNRDPILSKTGEPLVNYEKKEIKWIVTVNKANHPIDNAIVTDTLPEGLTISKDHIKVLKGTIDVTDGHTIIVPTNDGTEPTEITIDLGNINEEYTIEYTTKITDFNIDEFLNKASLGGEGVGPGLTIDPVPVYPAANEFGKNFIGVNYDEKTISWESFVIPTREALETLKVTDTFPNAGLILLPDTLKVTIGGEEKTLGLDKDYTLTAINGEYNEGFVVEFKKAALPIEKVVKISYDTSYDPEEGILENTGNGLYKNQVQFKGKTVNGNDFDQTRNAEHKVNDETINTGKKEGKLKSIDSKGNLVDGWISGNERKLEWTIYTNYLNQDLGTGVIIDDKLGYNGKIDKDSVVIKPYSVNAEDGKTNISDMVLLDSYYKVELKNADDTEADMRITFNDDFKFEKRYAVVFTTSVPDISQSTYTNTATTEVKGTNYPYTGSINFEDANNHVTKENIGGKSEVYLDDEVNWNITINESLSTIKKDVTITDTISEGMVYKKDSLKVYEVIGENREEVSNYELTNPGDDNKLIIKFNDSISSTYEIEYTTIIIKTGELTNSVKYQGSNDFEDKLITVKLSSSQFSYASGEWSRDSKGEIKIIKVDAETGAPIKTPAEFEVYYYLNNVKEDANKRIISGGSFTTDNNGEITIGNLPLGNTYYIKEESAPIGFEKSNDVEEIKVEKNANDKIYELEIKNKNIKTDITGNKVWVDGDTLTRPTIKLQLLRDDVTLEAPVILEHGTTSYTWENLNTHDNNGREYKYTIVEEVRETSETYPYATPEYSNDGLTITNTYIVPKTEVSVTKIWKGGYESDYEVEIQLFIDGEPVEDVVTLKGKEPTTHKWEGLDKTDKQGVPYKYTVKEVKGPRNYYASTKEVTDGEFEITNIYVPPTTSVLGKKVWVGGPEIKPDVTLQLMRDGEAFRDPVTLSDGEDYYLWTGLDDTSGYKYTVKEVNVPENYKATYSEDGRTVTNTYKVPKTDITGSKVWVGGPSVKPTVELQLYKDGEKHLESVLLENNKTTHTWKSLDKTDIDGNEFTYTIKEVNTPKDYKETYSEDGLTVTNTYVSEKIDVTGSKEWIGGPDVKPTIQLQLYRNNKAYLDPVTLVNGTLEHTWKDLDYKDSNGEMYTYTISEVEVPGDYDAYISEDGLTVTNVHFSTEDEYDPNGSKPLVPPTGINNNQLFYLSTLTLGGLGLIALRRKREKEFN